MADSIGHSDHPGCRTASRVRRLNLSLSPLTRLDRMFILPFSPRWLITQGREEEAFAIVQQLHGNMKSEEFTKLEFAEMCALSSITERGLITRQGRANQVRKGTLPDQSRCC